MYKIQFLIFEILQCYFIQRALGEIQLLELSEGTLSNSSISNGIQLVRSQSNIDLILPKTLSIKVRGIWQWHDVQSNFTDIWDSESLALRSEDLDEYENHIVDVRRIGGADLNEESLTLYEGHLYGEYPFPAEHHFTDSWTGEPFPLNWFAYTGWSNWTLFEGRNFTGNSLCLEAWDLFGQNEADDPPYPLSVGSVLKGCSNSTAKISPK